MRLWHYKLIPFLPNSQLIAQWRELNSIFKKQDKHILINYVYEYDIHDLYNYSLQVIEEILKRKIKICSIDKMCNYFENKSIYKWNMKKELQELIDTYNKKGRKRIILGEPVFKNHHTNRYLLQCFYNLQEKYDRGQKDFSKEQYEKLEEFVKNESIR